MERAAASSGSDGASIERIDGSIDSDGRSIDSDGMAIERLDASIDAKDARVDAIDLPIAVPCELPDHERDALLAARVHSLVEGTLAELRNQLLRVHDKVLLLRALWGRTLDPYRHQERQHARSFPRRGRKREEVGRRMAERPPGAQKAQQQRVPASW
jgi:hypothetical protein